MRAARFLPRELRAAWAADPEREAAPRREGGPAAFLMADISGSTALVREYSERGRDGIEEFTTALNDYFGAAIDGVAAAGGDVVSFAGDAFLAVFRPRDGGVAEATRRAAAVALQLQSARRGGTARAPLGMKVAVTAGTADLVQVGGLAERWLHFAVGDCIDQVGPVLEAAETGQVLLSETAWGLVAEHGDGVQVGAGPWLLTQISAPSPGDAPDSPAISAAAESQLRMFVPSGVRRWAEAGSDTWAAELRRVSSIFVSLPYYDRDEPSWLESVHAAVLRAQRAIYRLGGAVDKLLADEKGFVLIAAWGIPGAAHEDDDLRAVLAGRDLCRTLSQDGFAASVGIARGATYCGPVGNERRAEFTIMGPSVNLAARLRSVAEGRAVCAADLADLDARTLEFRGMPALPLKGYDRPVPMFEIKDRRERRSSTLSVDVFGRDAELEAFSDRLERLIDGGEGGLFALVGEAGLGKSSLMSAMRLTTSKRGARRLYGEGSAVMQSEAYAPFRAVVADLVGVDPLATHDPGLAQRVMDTLFLDPDKARRAPLLEDILTIGIEETEFTRGLEGAARADNLVLAVADIVTAVAAQGPLVLFLDDLHWFDSASWSLLRVLVMSVPNVLFVTCTRPLQPPIPPEWSQLVATDQATILELGGLTSPAIRAVVGRMLGASQLPDELTAVLDGKGEGNPFYAEQLALALVDAGHLQVVDDACVVSVDGGLTADLVPNRLSELVTARVDRLAPSQQFALKLAATLGRLFELRALSEILESVGSLAVSVGEMIADLIERRLIRPVEDLTGWLEFRHVLAREAIYDSMLLSQRRDLHAASLTFYEHEERPPIALLAHHADGAEDWTRAVEYIGNAGSTALARGANVEARRLIRRAMSIAENHPVTPSHVQLLAWHETLSEASFRVGDMVTTSESAQAALGLLRFPVPSTPGRRSVAAFTLLLRNMLRLPAPAALRNAPTDPVELERILHLLNRLTDAFGYLFDLGIVLTIQLLHGLGKRRDHPEAQALGLVMGYFMVAITPFRDRYAHWIPEAEALVADVERPRDRARVLARSGGAAMYRLDWDHTTRNHDEAMRIASEIGATRLQLEIRFQSGHLHAIRGEMGEALRVVDILHAASRVAGDRQSAGWADLIGAVALQACGDHEPAMARLRRAEPWLDDGAAPASVVWGRGLRAWGDLQAGDTQAARDGAIFAVDFALAQKAMVYWMIDGLVGATRVLAELAGDDPQARAALVRAHKAIKKLAGVVPFTAALTPWSAGLVAQSGGKSSKARALLAEAIERCDRDRLVGWAAIAAASLAVVAPETQADADRRAETLVASRAEETAAA